MLRQSKCFYLYPEGKVPLWLDHIVYNLFFKERIKIAAALETKILASGSGICLVLECIQTANRFHHMEKLKTNNFFHQE